MVRAVVLDFDGVILDSVGIKTKAFARLFEDKGAAVVQQVVDYHLANGGVSRFRKFAHIYANILGEELPEAESIRLGERFRALAFDEVSKAAWIPGVLEFLHDYHKRYLLFVASGTPQDELQQIIRRRELEQYFVGAFGSPATKAEILNRIVAENRLEKAEMVFVGDTMTDFHAAMESGVKFIGIAPDSGSPFPISAKVLPDLRRLAEAIGE
jgi:phosphoglycolate phosphatase-like HAD superfamily hydrolase